MASPLNLRLLSHPLNWFVVGVVMLFWLVVWDVIARHYAHVSNPISSAT
jgi:hypothetical protein